MLMGQGRRLKENQQSDAITKFISEKRWGGQKKTTKNQNAWKTEPKEKYVILLTFSMSSVKT